MSRAVVTHFDGDPFTINAWLRLYQDYWRGECDAVYGTLYYNPAVIPPEVVAFDKTLFADFPEIHIDVVAKYAPPEAGNQQTLKTVKEDYVGLIESDGLIYGRGVVDQCFRLLEYEGQDIIAPPWYLIDDPYFNGDLQSKGFMRCFTFAKMELLRKTDLDFMPRTIPVNYRVTDEYQTVRPVPLDCFGWLSWQLLLLTKKITYTPANILGPDNIFAPYSNFKWVHVRQMSSSAIGMGGAEYALWQQNDAKLLERVMRLFTEDWPGGPAEFIHIKAVAFKLLFWDILKSKQTLGNFADDYRHMLEAVIEYYAMPRIYIYEIKGFYKGLFNI